MGESKEREKKVLLGRLFILFDILFLDISITDILRFFSVKGFGNSGNSSGETGVLILISDRRDAFSYSEASSNPLP